MEELISGLKYGAIVLLIVPGFIFSQIIDLHLLREKKAQFEKTLAIILWSAFIWSIIGIFPYSFPYADEKKRLYEFLIVLSKVDVQNYRSEIARYPLLFIDFIKYYFTVCMWSLLFAHTWGLLRKSWKVDQIISLFTGRNWYPNVSFQFYKENLNRVVEFTLKERRFLGILSKAPDTIDDIFLLIINVHEFTVKEGLFEKTIVLEPLPLIESMLVKTTEIQNIAAYTDHLLKSQPKKNIWSSLWGFIKLLFWRTNVSEKNQIR